MTNHSLNTLSDAELRLQLRGLPKERELERDLWSGIQATIQNTPARKQGRAWSNFAMAASLVLIAVMALPLLSPKQAADSDAMEAKVVSSEVHTMDVEYQAALKEYAAVEFAPEVKAQLQLLDDSANKLRQALAQSPQSSYLIPMLRRTYLQRLQLTHRAFASNLS